MARFRTAVTANEDIEALVGRNQTETTLGLVSHSSKAGSTTLLFALSLGTLTDTSRDAALKLVRCSDTLVSFFEADRHTDTVSNTEATPCGSDTTLSYNQPRRRDAMENTHLDRSERLRIGMATLHTTFYQLRPDSEKVLLLGTEHVDSLTTSDFTVEVILLGYLADGDKFIGRDLTSRNSRDDGECAIALDISQESVIGVLQLVNRLIH